MPGKDSSQCLYVYSFNRHELMKIKPYPDVVQNVAAREGYLCFPLVAPDALVRSEGPQFRTSFLSQNLEPRDTVFQLKCRRVALALV